MIARFLVLGFLTAVTVSAQTAVDEAKALVKAKRYPEARAALESIVAAEPNNAAALHELGLVCRLNNKPNAHEEALKHLARAIQLEPNNATFLGNYGGTSLEYAGRARSYSAATKGRDAMEKAIALNPDYVEARVGLYHFYRQAPWPLGSSAKAAVQLEEIRKRDPEQATALSVLAKVAAKEYPAAFQLCEDVLAKKPNDYVAMYQYGRTASMSGQNLDRGLALLQRCLEIDPPSPTTPTHSHVWQRIGRLHEKRSEPELARAAYESALKLDPSNKSAADALAKLNAPTP
jgi:tetratricopeptide (TPR) repeat protein